MKRIFKKGCVVINNKKYETVLDYDTSILEWLSIKIVKNPWSQKVFVYFPTKQERRLLGTAAKFITLKEKK